MSLTGNHFTTYGTVNHGVYLLTNGHAARISHTQSANVCGPGVMVLGGGFCGSPQQWASCPDEDRHGGDGLPTPPREDTTRRQ